MSDVTVPAAPALTTVPNVELCQTGTWNVSTGIFTFTVDDFVAAVAALDCPAVHNPVVKIGHTDPRFDGEPAIGWIGNMCVADDGRSLVGDYKGVPSWLATPDATGNTVLASAWPQRSIEGQYDFQCQMGHTHPFVVTAVALLGVMHPGVGTLQSLQDVADLYGVVAASAPTGVAFHVRASEGTVMPNPSPLLVAASVSADDVRRAFYDSDVGRAWSAWIEEIQLDPALQVIYVDDESGDRFRLPVTITAGGDGDDAVSFGTPIKVVIRYDDAPTQVAASGEQPKVLRFASRDESRPRTPKTPAASPAVGPQKGAGMDPAKLREDLGLPADASDTEVAAKLAADGLIPKASEPVTPAAPPTPAPDAPAPTPAPAVAASTDTVTLDRATFDQLQNNAQAGAAARVDQLKDRREQLVAAAIGDGRIAPARKDHWLKQLEVDPGAEAVLASLEKGLIPVAASGYAGTSGDDDVDASLEAEIARLHRNAGTGTEG